MRYVNPMRSLIPPDTILCSGSGIVIPILAQRLLINMRKVDYIGSEPVASKLLFAPPAAGSEDDLDEDANSFEMVQGQSSLRHGGVVDGPSALREVAGGSNSA